MHVSGSNGLAVMLATKSSAGAAPEMDLKNPLHDGNKSHKWGIRPGLKTQGRCHQKFKTGVAVAPQVGLINLLQSIF